jgi:hypothetical protein
MGMNEVWPYTALKDQMRQRGKEKRKDTSGKYLQTKNEKISGVVIVT